MQRMTSWTSRALAVLIAGLLVTGSVHADKPGNQAGKNRHKEKRESSQERDNVKRGRYSNKNGYFLDRHRTVIHDYYAEQFRARHCPPGLAKKQNGCMPPGQAKKWRIGRPLPRDVIFYDLPPVLVRSLGPAPAGHRYVRVAADILLITIGTGMVVDALQDLGRL